MLANRRPWPTPEKSWVMKQIWHQLLFAHWPISTQVIQALVPRSLPIDTYDGNAWISIVPFHMSKIHLRGLPPIPCTSKFAEINVRTYVTLEDKPGVYFFSLDAANRLAVTMARRLFHLPYYYASMSISFQGQSIEYASKRRRDEVEFIGVYRPTSEVFHSTPGSLEQWLTDRYCLYSHHQNKLYRCEIFHQPWPLQFAEAIFVRNTMARPIGIRLPDVPPLLHYADKLEVNIWPLEQIGKEL